MSRFSTLLCSCAFLAGLVGVSVLAPKPDAYVPAPEVGEDNPLAREAFRYQQRLDADGTMPADYLMRAVEAKKQVSMRGGPKSPLSWSYLGPKNFGGRIRAVVVHPTNFNIMWVGSSGGGIWKTTDGGVTWNPMDDFLPGMSVSCLVLDPTNPNVLYAGTGEGFFETVEGSTNTACIRGAGIFKSIDGGATWAQLPTTANPQFYFVNRLSISPADSRVLLAGTSTGIYRTTNGGASWTKTLANEWVYDVDFHPTDASKAITGVHENGVFYTTDGGLTWTRSTSVTAHRSEIEYSRSNPSIVYNAAAEGGSVKIWKSTDGGVTFTQQGAAGIGTYEAYNIALWVNPLDPTSIVYGGVYLYRSTDSGATSANVLGDVHADMHAIVSHPSFNGSSNKTVFIGCDGGLYRIPDFSGSTANFYTGIGITQFYGAAINPISGRVMGGTQDNYTLLYRGDPNNWSVTAGGDGGYNQTDPTDQNFFYGCIYWAYQFRSVDGGVNADYCYGGPNPITDSGDAANCNFINPFTLDPNTPNRMLVGTIRLWRSNNVKAATPDWFVIKPSIAPGNKPDGGNAHFAPNNPYNISAVAVAKGNSNVIWVGHNNGSLFVTTNGTSNTPTWNRVDTFGPLPDRWISKIAIDPLNPNHVYVSFLGWHDDSIWETTNGGNTWRDIATGKLIPASVNVVALHPTISGYLFAGTDLGLFASTDNGATWTSTSQGPGTVSVEEIAFKDSTTMVLATYGRGMWMGTISPSGVPRIDSLSPTSGTAGAPGMTLTVTGANFGLSSVVKWAGANRPTTFVSSTELRASLSAGDLAFAQTVSVQVVTPPPGGGSSNTVSYAINNPAPVLSTMSPMSRTAGSAGFTLSVSGSNFVSTSKIVFNGVPRNTVLISSNRLTATIPAADFQTAGDYPVRVRNPQPGGGDSSTLTFTALPVGPSSVAISPQTPTGGTSCVGAVYLNGPAPVGGVAIALSKVGDAIGIPSTVTASAGSSSAVFTVTTTPVSIDTTCTVLATVGTITRSGSVIVRAPRPNSVVLNPSSVRSGQSSSGTFTLTGPAPIGGISVDISTGAPSLVQVPPTVFVPAGGTGGTFPITTRPYGGPVDIAVWALYKKKGASALLHLTP